MTICKVCGDWAVRVNRAEHKFVCRTCGHITTLPARRYKPKPKPQPKAQAKPTNKISH